MRTFIFCTYLLGVLTITVLCYARPRDNYSEGDAELTDNTSCVQLRAPYCEYIDTSSFILSLSNPDASFFTACGIGTVAAFQNFLEEFPSSHYASIAKNRIIFLKEVDSADINSYKRFIERNPDNPFVVEAEASIPLLWLHHQNKSIGVNVQLESDDKTSTEKTRRKIFDRVNEKYLLDEGIIGSLIQDDSSGQITRLGRSSLILDVKYGEQKISNKSRTIGTGSMSGDLHKQAVANAVGIIASLFNADVTEYYRYTIREQDVNFVYCSDLFTLTQKAKDNDILKFLGSYMDDRRVVPSLLILGNSVNPDIRAKALFMLVV
jgi:hypothetical protein